MSNGSADQALAARTDLDAFSNAKRTLFALQLTLAVDDILSIAATVVTDGPDDKSCDVIYLDRELGKLIIAQEYTATSANKLAASQTKASTLRQAVSWVLGQTPTTLPQRLQPAAKEVRQAFTDDIVQSVELWFVHNLPESLNVQTELDAICTDTRAILERLYPQLRSDPDALTIRGHEVGQRTLDEWYRASLNPISINQSFQVPVLGAFQEDGDGWRAICTSVDASWLYDLFHEYGTLLFSPNVRSYLGSRQSPRNINAGIKATVQREPDRLWAYNNGVTAIVHDAKLSSDGRTLTVNGLGIVNGAQTTGAIGNAAEVRSQIRGRVLVRFIKSESQETVRNIIRYNNRQNPTAPADFRSNDPIQARLVDEFADLGVVGYTGGRRGGVEDVIRRPGANQISAVVAAQALAAFHQDPGLAYLDKALIWQENERYSQIFTEQTTARHVLLCFTLLRSVQAAKLALAQKGESHRTRDEETQYALLRQRGSEFLLVAAIGGCMDTYLARSVNNPFSLEFGGAPDILEAQEIWNRVVLPAMPLGAVCLGTALTAVGGLRSRSSISDAIVVFRGLVSSTYDANRERYQKFAAIVRAS